MPTAKRRITITVTGQIERDLDIVWNAYPNLRDNAIETIAFVLTLKASELLTGTTIKPVQEATVTPESVPDDSGDDEEEWTD
ncbi:hypothetical protein NC981_21515 [Leptolyngbya sp. DQ-M1]|uniref:hypothetical protein n=1 Tax=Leptolyngbya sp. DQ-M1 TaxID=2933920 RepID=UPI0032997E98